MSENKFSFSEAYESDVDEDQDQDQQDIPSLDKTYDLPEHVVTVTTIDDIDLNTDRFPVIGPNKVRNKLNGNIIVELFMGVVDNHEVNLRILYVSWLAKCETHWLVEFHFCSNN